MDLARWIWAIFAMLVAIATAESISPSNSTTSFDGDSGSNGQIKLSLSDGDHMDPPVSDVVGLTDHSRSDIPV